MRHKISVIPVFTLGSANIKLLSSPTGLNQVTLELMLVAFVPSHIFQVAAYAHERGDNSTPCNHTHSPGGLVRQALLFVFHRA